MKNKDLEAIGAMAQGVWPTLKGQLSNSVYLELHLAEALDALRFCRQTSREVPHFVYDGDEPRGQAYMLAKCMVLIAAYFKMHGWDITGITQVAHDCLHKQANKEDQHGCANT